MISMREQDPTILKAKAHAFKAKSEKVASDLHHHIKNEMWSFEGNERWLFMSRVFNLVFEAELKEMREKNPSTNPPPSIL